ncbi:acyl-CoA dehydrogenase family protein [Streptomyces sp. NPDC059002]|uniref:acyl-CoA dehydrogenase family protein n=1 Tax=Streptomyces sp. NPDC059002 TaxID=3346690 RepID=UPI003699A7A4
MLTADRTPGAHLPTPSAHVPAHAAVAALAADDRAATDDRRSLSAPLTEALTAAGFPRHFVPVEHGGAAGTFGGLLDSVAGVGEACASTAWVAALYAAHGRLAAYLPRAGRDDLWRSGPDVRIAASVVPPRGEAVAEPDGWRLTGSWGLASGVDHADWVLLASRTPGEGEAGHRIFAVPRERVTVTDTWHSVGLRGTGSNSVAVTDEFVPAHRTFTLADLGRVRPDVARCHRVPYAMVAALMFAAPALGSAQGALRDWRTRMTDKVGADGRPAIAGAAARQLMARGSAQIHSAELLLRQAAREADHADVTPLSVASNRRDAALAVELCSGAVDSLWRAMGASGLAEGDPVQRRWHDIAAVASHAAVRFEPAAEAYMSALLASEGAA